MSVNVLKGKCQIKHCTFGILNAWVTFKSLESGENCIWIQIIRKAMILFRNVKVRNYIREKSIEDIT